MLPCDSVLCPGSLIDFHEVPTAPMFGKQCVVIASIFILVFDFWRCEHIERYRAALDLMKLHVILTNLTYSIRILSVSELIWNIVNTNKKKNLATKIPARKSINRVTKLMKQ